MNTKEKSEEIKTEWITIQQVRWSIYGCFILVSLAVILPFINFLFLQGNILVASFYFLIVAYCLYNFASDKPIRIGSSEEGLFFRFYFKPLRVHNHFIFWSNFKNNQAFIPWEDIDNIDIEISMYKNLLTRNQINFAIFLKRDFHLRMGFLKKSEREKITFVWNRYLESKKSPDK